MDKDAERPGCLGRHLLFIVNPVAAAHRAQERWNGFLSRLQQKNMRMDWVATTGPGHAFELARRATPEYDLLAAVGGDGTACEVADGILSAQARRSALAIVPFGTGNDAAQVLGIRTEADALHALTAGFTRSIDAIRIHCHWGGKPIVRHALLFAGVGIIAESLKKTTPACKRLFGQQWAYPVGLIRALWSYHSPRINVTCDQQLFEQRFLFVGASNTPIAGGGMRISPGARIDDGLLNLNLVGAMGRGAALLQLRRLCQGRHLGHPQMRYFTAREMEICSPGLEIAADGELIGETPALISIEPNALQVLAPCTSEATSQHPSNEGTGPSA